MILQQISQLLEWLGSPENYSEKEWYSQMLAGVCELPDIDTANLLLQDAKEQTVCLVWNSFDGTLLFGNWSPVKEHPLHVALEHKTVWLEGDESFTGLLSLEDIYRDRCILPIPTPTTTHLLLLYSRKEATFAGWNRDLLTLLGHHLGLHLHSTQCIDTLHEQINLQTQQATLNPPHLFGAMHMARALQNELAPTVAYLQNNLHILPTYQQSLQDLLDYQLDEIRLHVGAEGVQRIQELEARLNVTDIRADLATLQQDLTDGIFQLSSLLTTLESFHQQSNEFAPFDVTELFAPLLPFVFAKQLPQIKMQWEPSLPPVYGDRARLQKALFLLLLAVQEQMDWKQEPAQLQIKTEAKETHLSLQLLYSSSQQPNGNWSTTEERYLFAKRVLEEYQGEFSISNQDDQCTMELTIPLMFSSQEKKPQESGSFEAMASSFSQVHSEGALVLDAFPAFGDAQEAAPTKTQRLMVLLLSEDPRYLRSLRRILSAQHEVFFASTSTTAIDILNAQSDLDIVFCDLQGEAEACLDLMDHLQAHNPHQINRVCFLLGNRLSSRTLEFSRRLSNRCIPRGSSAQELNQFMQERAQVTTHSFWVSPHQEAFSSPSLDALPAVDEDSYN